MSEIEVNGIKLHYEIEGEGFPLILLHGLSDDLNYWMFLPKEYYETFKIIKIDLRGHGKTELGNQELSMELLADDIYKLIQKLEIEECNILGFSLGGCIAISLAEKYPNLIKKLVLLSTYAKLNENGIQCLKNFENSLDISYESFFDTIITHVLPEPVYNEVKEDLEEIKAMKSETTNLDWLKKIIQVNYTFDGEKDLDKITAETLVICADEDDFILSELSETINEKIANSKLIKIEFVKHNLFIGEYIEKLNKLIFEFLLDE